MTGYVPDWLTDWFNDLLDELQSKTLKVFLDTFQFLNSLYVLSLFLSHDAYSEDITILKQIQHGGPQPISKILHIIENPIMVGAIENIS